MIDWQTGKIVSDGRVGKGSTWSLVSAGDWAALPAFVEQMLKNPCDPYGALLPVIRDADLAIVNLETVLSDRGTSIIKCGPNLRGPADAIHSLVEAGFGVAVLANNHTLDFGCEALKDTMDLCRAHGIETVGAGLTMERAWAPAYVDVGDTRVAILAMAEHEESGFWPGMKAGAAAWDIAKAVQAVRRARKVADVVIYQCHVGTEFNPIPAPRVSEGFRRLVDAGASLVIGHHPHVPMGVEIYNQAIIAYGLGNFMFDFSHKTIAARVNEGYMLGVTFDGNRIVGGQIYPYRAINGHHLEWLQGERERDLLGHLERISRPLGNADLLWEYWWAFCDDLYHHRWESMLPEVAQALSSDKQAIRIEQGASRLRNVLRCEAHWDTLHTALDRIVRGQPGSSRPEVVVEVRALNPWLSTE